MNNLRRNMKNFAARLIGRRLKSNNSTSNALKSFSAMEAVCQAERILLDHHRSGEGCDFKADNLTCPYPKTEYFENKIRGAFLRQIILSNFDGNFSNTSRFEIRGAAIAGLLDLRGASLKTNIKFVECVFDEVIELDGAQTANLEFYRCSIFQLILSNSRVEGSLKIYRSLLERGVIAHGVLISGDFLLDGTEIIDIGLSADRIRVQGAIFLRECTVRGLCRFPAAKIGSHFSAEGTNFLSKNTALQIFGADIGGWLSLEGSCLRSQTGRSLQANNLSVSQWVSCVNTTFFGSIFMIDAVVGSLNFDGAEIIGKDDRGYALNLSNLECRLHLLFRNGFKTLDGGVRIAHANIGANLDITGCNISSDIWPALQLEQAKVGADFFLREDSSSMDKNSIQAQITGGLVATSAEVRGSMIVDGVIFSSNRSIHLNRMRIGALIRLWKVDFADATLSLANTHVDAFADDPRSWPKPGNLILNGFEYNRISGEAPTNAKMRIEWLRRQRIDDCKAGLRSQPFNQLVTVLSRMGHDEDALCINISRHRCQRQSLSIYSPRKLASYVLDISSGYGYRPWRTLLVLLILAIIGSVVFNSERGYFTAIKDPKYTLRRDHTMLPIGYPDFNPVVYSIDTMLPFISLGQKDYWAPTKGGKAKWAWIYRPFHLVIGWFFATIFLGAVTGIIRK